MQETLTLKAADGKVIYVEVNSSPKNKAAVLCIHGFTSSNVTHIWFNAANSWPQKGFDTYRVALYPGRDGRSMRTIRWEDNLGDTKKVLAYLKRRYSKVFIVGHSLGATNAVYIADKTVAGVVLWDPPYAVDLAARTAPQVHPDYYTLDWGGYELSPKVYVDAFVKAANYTALKKFPCPTLMVRASNNTEGWPSDLLPVKTVVIPNSDHSFHKEGAEKKLFAATLKYFKTQL